MDHPIDEAIWAMFRARSPNLCHSEKVNLQRTIVDITRQEVGLKRAVVNIVRQLRTICSQAHALEFISLESIRQRLYPENWRSQIIPS